jgi:hypothetical protein
MASCPGGRSIWCLPVHLSIARLSPPAAPRQAAAAADQAEMAADGPDPNRLFALMLAGFALEGFALSALLVHMVPLTQALGLGTFGLYGATLFGPAQVASRLVNLMFGGALSQTWLAVLSALLLPLGISVLLPTAPSIAGAVVFAICMGLGSGLTSIVGGTLPLELFGRAGYGARLGWSTAVKQFSAAIAPFAMSAAMSGIGVGVALAILATASLIAAAAFLGIALMRRRPRLRLAAS